MKTIWVENFLCKHFDTTVSSVKVCELYSCNLKTNLIKVNFLKS